MTDTIETNSQEAGKPSNTITLHLLPKTFRNDLYEQNLHYFKRSQPQIYNAIINHDCESYWICSSANGSPNILNLKTKQPLYTTFNTQDLLRNIDESIGNMSCIARLADTFLGGKDDIWKQNNPIQYGMLQKLYEKGIFKEYELSHDDLRPLQKFNNDFMPLVRVYGIGLGYHITGLIKMKNISFMSIYEPHLDLFYTSLYTTPWELIFQYFERKNKNLNLILGASPEDAIKKNLAFISNKLLSLTTFYYRYKHVQTPDIENLIKIEHRSDSVAREQSDAGWYEDQRIGFYLSARNIKEKKKYFTGKQIQSFCRAFVVGAGPSLNESIIYLKKHQKDGIIISCGSAITPLLKAGIVPDYEVVQERVWQFEEHEQKHDLDLLKKITLLKLNVVSTKIDRFYKDTLVFQKFRDPGSSLLSKKYPVTTAVNPTVTNAGIAMCAALGVKEVFLFGVDYGAPVDSERMHAKDTFYDDERVDDSVVSKTPFELPGNLGATIKTDPVLSWSHNTTEMKIAEFPQIKWFNIGEGAYIKGAKPIAVTDLPATFKKKISKKKLIEEIQSCFDNKYSADAVMDHLQNNQIQQVDEYLEALAGFSQSTPQTREEILGVLSLMYKAAHTGKEQSGYLPSSLLPYGFTQFINNVYIQCSLARDDSRAVNFFHYATEVLGEYISDIKGDLSKIISLIDAEEESDLVVNWRKMGS